LRKFSIPKTGQLVGAVQIALAAVLFWWFLRQGGLTIGFIPPAILLAGKGLANLLTWK
jgi:hypothetical protein